MPPTTTAHEPVNALFTNIEDDPVGVLLGTGMQRFETAIGVEGLARVGPDRLDVLAVAAKNPGTGQFRRFIAAAKEQFITIGVWEDWNPMLSNALARYGFTRATDTLAGEVVKGWLWTRP